MAKRGGGGGFAAMSEEKRREIARKGGQEAQRRGTAHRFTPETASAAGRKGARARREATEGAES